MQCERSASKHIHSIGSAAATAAITIASAVRDFIATYINVLNTAGRFD